MRIIAGRWRGRRLIAPNGQQTRPTADRARETLFSMLTSRLGGFTDLAVADLFAGSGALGLEALSRGAKHCLFIEQDRAAINTIRDNVAALGASTVADIRQAAADRPGVAVKPYDIIFIDPPYGTANLSQLVDDLVSRGWTHGETIISIETGISVETGHGLSPEPASCSALASRTVGKAVLHLFQPGE